MSTLDFSAWLNEPLGAGDRSFEVRRQLHTAAWDDDRYRRLDRHHAFYLGLEYAHLSKSWAGLPADKVDAISPDCAFPQGPIALANNDFKTIHELRPTAPLRMCPMIVDRFTGLLFSEGRRPRVSVEGESDADDWLREVMRAFRFWRAITKARNYAGAMGSALVTSSLRDGRFVFTARPGKVVQDIAWADDDHRAPKGVLIQYVFDRQVQELSAKTGRPTGRSAVHSYLYRRIIDDHADIVYRPVRYKPGEPLPEMELDPDRSRVHGLGRFPGAWILNLEGDDPLDGVPDCDGTYQAMQMIDIQNSQTNKALINNQDPTLVYGRDRKLEQIGVPLRKGSENSLNVGIGGFANYLEMTAGAQAASIDFVKMFRQAVLDKCQCVIPDRDDPSFSAQSGKALEFRFASMLEKAGRLRDQWGEAIETLADVILEQGRQWVDPANYADGATGMFRIMPRLEEHDDDQENPDPAVGRRLVLVERTPGVGGNVSVKWGAYFEKTALDTQARVNTLTSAYGSTRIDGETTTRELADALDLKDADAILRRVRQEADQRRAQQLEAIGMATPEEMHEVELGPDGLPVSQAAAGASAQMLNGQDPPA